VERHGEGDPSAVALEWPCRGILEAEEVGRAVQWVQWTRPTSHNSRFEVLSKGAYLSGLRRNARHSYPINCNVGTSNGDKRIGLATDGVTDLGSCPQWLSESQ